MNTGFRQKVNMYGFGVGFFLDQSLGMFIDFAKAVANHRDRSALRDLKAAKEIANCQFLFTTPFY